MSFKLPDGSAVEQYYVRKSAFPSVGSLWGWGGNNFGQIGDNSTSLRSSPVQTVATDNNWCVASAGDSHAGAVKTNGTLWLWGNGLQGRIGDNTTSHKSSPVQTIAGGTNWKTVSCGYNFTMATKTDGTLWTWGSNSHGELGDNTLISKSSPVQTICGGTNWTQVSCSGNASYQTAAAIKTDGTLWTWGNNISGQLGDNSVASKSSPVQTIAGGTNWKTVGGDIGLMVAIKTDGTLWTWGANTYGQLGDNTINSASSPVQTIAGGTTWKVCSGGNVHTAAIKIDGTLWVWGRNDVGQLGIDSGPSSHKSSPVQTVAGGNNWKTVSCGTSNTHAIKTDGSMWGFGAGTGIGDGSIVPKSSPVQILTSTYWLNVDGGVSWALAISK